jgi:2,3-bisphosphoglycerate-dependent phosphoglycerate mutase
MTVGFQVDYLWYPVGHGDFLHAFFSTISYHLEPDGWGTRYPHLMNKLYRGKLPWSEVPDAVKELEDVRMKLANMAPDQVIWDIDDLTKQPPWGHDISPDITSLANYFVTSDGRDLFDVLLMALRDAWNEKNDLEIVSL